MAEIDSVIHVAPPPTIIDPVLPHSAREEAARTILPPAMGKNESPRHQAVRTTPRPVVKRDTTDLSADSLHMIGDSLAIDTVPPVDTTPRDTLYYLMLDAPAGSRFEPHAVGRTWSDAMSWFMTGVFLLFIVTAIRYRKNSKYFSAIFRDAVEVRERGNVFDETVREKTFIILLNLLWCVSAGILLYTLLGTEGAPRASTPALTTGVVFLWQLGMTGAYQTVGYVFSDRVHTAMWVNGYLAVCGLSTLLIFPPALLALCYPQHALPLLWVALGGFVAAKLVFIWKGFRIFFKDIASWVLFLYYLCSLEIVPLILLYVAARLVNATFP